MIYTIPIEVEGEKRLFKVDSLTPHVCAGYHSKEAASKIREEQELMYKFFPQFALCASRNNYAEFPQEYWVYSSDGSAVTNVLTGLSLPLESTYPIYEGFIPVDVTKRPYKNHLLGLKERRPYLLAIVKGSVFLKVPLMGRYSYEGGSVENTLVSVSGIVWEALGFEKQHFYGNNVLDFCSFRSSSPYMSMVDHLRDRVLSRIILEISMAEIKIYTPRLWGMLENQVNVHDLYNNVGTDTEDHRVFLNIYKQMLAQTKG